MPSARSCASRIRTDATRSACPAIPRKWCEMARLKRYALIALASVIVIAVVFPADRGRAAPTPSPSDQAQLEHSFDAAISPDDLRDWMKVLASEPNQVGSPHDKRH